MVEQTRVNPDRDQGLGTPAPQSYPRRTLPLFVGPGFVTPEAISLAPPTVEEIIASGETPPIMVLIPNSFREMIFHSILVNRSREASVVVEQAVAAGATGTITVNIPAGVIDIQRFFEEGGDGAISYSVDIQSVGQTAVGSHRITGGEREFARYWEKTGSVIVNFTNNDLINASLIQLTWISVQLDTVKWTVYRDNLEAWSRILGVQP